MYIQNDIGGTGNIVGMAFPLFTKQMYKTLDFKWANTLFGCLGTAMVPIPFVRQFLPSGMI
jgi:hypothetical protein